MGNAVVPHPGLSGRFLVGGRVWRCVDCPQQGHSHEEQRIIIRRDPVRIVLATTAASMDQHLLTIAAHQFADRLHRGVTIALAVAGMAIIDMATPQAVGAMIAVDAVSLVVMEKLGVADAFVVDTTFLAEAN